ncbi:HipA family kinase [Levilactobacillus brevis]|uniref:HipA family kinase n=1 Tax=Levilactobacillus brevis TaxID=1580 RepID=UPI0025A627C3|nr:HipA family kinase [Levilactobacillus brevis]
MKIIELNNKYKSVKGRDLLPIPNNNIYIDMILEEESPKQGCSKPVTIIASDGKKYILKNNMVTSPNYSTPSNQDAEFFQEALVSNIADELNIPTPNYAIVIIDDDTLFNFPDLRWKYKFTEGKYFATKMLPNIGNDLVEVFRLASNYKQPYAIRSWHSLFKNIINKEVIPDLIALDFLTINLDRFTNGGNLLFQYRPNGKWLVSIDYGYCFFSPYWNSDAKHHITTKKFDLLNYNNPKAHPEICQSYSACMMKWFYDRSTRANQSTRFKYGVVFDALQHEIEFDSQNPFNPVITKIESLTTTFFVNTISHIIPEWVSGGNVQKEAYVNFLSRQKSLIRPFIEYNRQITSLIRTSPESFNGSLLMMYF